VFYAILHISFIATKMGSPAARHHSAVGLLMFAGTLGNVIGKILYTLEAPGRSHHHHKKPFSKPWFATLLMFLGMFVCLPCSLLWRKFLKRHDGASPGNAAPNINNSSTSPVPEQEVPLLDHESNIEHEESTRSLESMTEASVRWWRKYDAILFPTFFDLFASGLLSIGLLYTTASLYQMIRGTEIIFTAILSVFLLHRRLNTQNLIGLALCAVGLSVVGYSGLLSSKDDGKHNSNTYSPFFSSSSSTSASQTLLGILLIIGAEAVQALQIVAEDFLMSAADTQIPPVEVVGYEGAFGLVIMGVFVLPALQFSRFGTEGNGLREDTVESFLMLSRSSRLLECAAGYVALMAAYNLAGMMVTENMGALSRTVAETLRTLLVWFVNIILYYKVKIKGAEGGHIGEPWTPYSWMQLSGFAIMVVGTACYAAGEEKHSNELKECLMRRARERWAMLRITVPRLLELARREEGGLSVEEKRLPVRRARIAGPARIRVALALMQLRKKVRKQRPLGGESAVGDGSGDENRA
jgi:drug/metabolite transporter (DMT)-like permease